MKRTSRSWSAVTALSVWFHAGCAPHDDAAPVVAGGGGNAALGVAGSSAEMGGLGGVGGSSAGGGGSAGGGSSGASGSAPASVGTTGGAVSEYARFASIGDIVTYKCGGAGCHAGEMEPRLVNDAGLYATLTSFVAKRCGNRTLVTPGSPEDSAFYLAQRGQCGTELPLMPLGCVDNCTPPEYVEAVRQWISLGAPP